MFARIETVVAKLLDTGKVVTPIDVLVGMELLARADLEDWRRGRVSCLERVIACNLTRLSRLLRILRFHAHDLNLNPSTTVYMRHRKGAKQRLRFTKTGDANLELAYSTHFVSPAKAFHQIATAGSSSTGKMPRRSRQVHPRKRNTPESGKSWR